MGKRMDAVEEWMRKFKIKTIVTAVAIVLLSALFLISCVTVQPRDLPEIVVEWIETNTYEVMKETSLGTAWWYDSTHLITACHVIKEQKSVIVRDREREKSFPVNAAYCDKDADIAILEYSGQEKTNIIPTIISDHPPKTGTALYSGGYPLGGVSGNSGRTLAAKITLR